MGDIGGDVFEEKADEEIERVEIEDCSIVESEKEEDVNIGTLQDDSGIYNIWLVQCIKIKLQALVARKR